MTKKTHAHLTNDLADLFGPEAAGAFGAAIQTAVKVAVADYGRPPEVTVQPARQPAPAPAPVPATGALLGNHYEGGMTMTAPTGDVFSIWRAPDSPAICVRCTYGTVPSRGNGGFAPNAAALRTLKQAYKAVTGRDLKYRRSKAKGRRFNGALRRSQVADFIARLERANWR